jgi:DNA-binding Xre family transcriptional regulator
MMDIVEYFTAFVHHFGQIFVCSVQTMGRYAGEFPKRLARKLKAIRGDAPVREMARKAGISKSAWNLLEQGRHSATLATVERICRRLKCQPGDLLDENSTWLPDNDK